MYVCIMQSLSWHSTWAEKLLTLVWSQNRIWYVLGFVKKTNCINNTAYFTATTLSSQTEVEKLGCEPILQMSHKKDFFFLDITDLSLVSFCFSFFRPCFAWVLECIRAVCTAAFYKAFAELFVSFGQLLHAAPLNTCLSPTSIRGCAQELRRSQPSLAEIHCQSEPMTREWGRAEPPYCVSYDLGSEHAWVPP